MKEEKLFIYYLGPSKTYSEEAAKIFAAKAKFVKETPILMPVSCLEDIINWLRTHQLKERGGKCFGVIPSYNYLQGLVQESLDVIYEGRMSIIGAVRVAIEFALGSYSKSDIRDAVYSHPKA